jgi:protein-disulfide isomerase
LAIPATPVSLGGAPSRGSAAARVAVLEYSDFQCQFCRRFVVDTLPTLLREYVDSGQVRIVFRHLPLEMHAAAEPAARASVCAAAQGRFWEAHDRFFGNPTFDQLFVSDVPTALGLDVARFGACTASAGRAQVEADVASAKALRVSGTPAFFIGEIDAKGSLQVRATLAGARPVGEFQAAIEQVLKEVKGQVNR